jgi:hypothetical protein
MNLLDLISRDVPLRRTSSKHGGEFSGPCPLCRRGKDRFKVWPVLRRWACLGFKAGRAGCDRSGDAIDYLRQRDGMSYADACAQLGRTQIVCPGRLPRRRKFCRSARRRNCVRRLMSGRRVPPPGSGSARHCFSISREVARGAGWSSVD